MKKKKTSILQVSYGLQECSKCDYKLRCDECTGKDKVLYECDRKRCKKCTYPVCARTHDVQHAVNFSNDHGIYIEHPRYTEVVSALQKQVDELTEERANLQAEIAVQKLKYEALICGRNVLAGMCNALDEVKKAEIREQAVKETAKEILQAVDKESNGQTASVTNVLRKRYCIEVDKDDGT